jgi:hypothetical protein
LSESGAIAIKSEIVCMLASYPNRFRGGQMKTKTVPRFNKRPVIPIVFFSALLLIVFILATISPIEAREDCVSRKPSLEGIGAFYELIDLKNKEVWGTPDFSAEEYNGFSAPFLWQKNEPRVSMSEVSKSGFLRSPGCPAAGQYTYMQAFDRDFLNVVWLISLNQPLDNDGLIRATELEKYHLLVFPPGATVYILESPDLERFIGVSRSTDRTTDSFTLPDGWNLTEHVLSQELQVELSGTVNVLRTDNEDSFQGPLPENLLPVGLGD